MKKEDLLRRGILLTVREEQVYVHFRHFNQRVTKCWLEAGEIDVEAIAKCNIEVDTFCERQGEHVSLQKAVAKLLKIMDDNVSDVQQEAKMLYEDIQEGLERRLERRWRKINKL